MSGTQERLVGPDVLNRQGDVLTIEPLPITRGVLGVIARGAILYRDPSPIRAGLTAFADWEDTLSRYDSDRQLWFRNMVDVIPSGMGSETRRTPVNFSPKPFISMGESAKSTEPVEPVTTFDVDQTILPGFVRGMFLTAQKAVTLTGHDYYAVRRATEPKVLLMGKHRRGINHMKDQLTDDDAMLATLIGRGYSGLVRGVSPNSWIGRTFELFSDELGDPNQYQLPTFSTRSLEPAIEPLTD